MKKNLKVLVTGLTIIILTNVVALTGVAYNRSGEPDALVQLTERELFIAYQSGLERHSTGLNLGINCRIINNEAELAYNNNNCWSDPHWFDKKKLLELGFAFEAYDKSKSYRYYERALPKDVYLVMEYDGEAHKGAIQRAEQLLVTEQALKDKNPGDEEFEDRLKRATEALGIERHYNSRLFAIDAGLDKDRLRETYPERDRYIIMKASVKPTSRIVGNGRIWTGRIKQLLIERINVPLEYRAALKKIRKKGTRRQRNNYEPRYAVKVAFGKRAEPWVVGVEVFEKD